MKSRRWLAAVLALLPGLLLAEPLTLHTRARTRSAADTNEWNVVEQTASWEATRTAVVICDMWDKHHCPDATERVGEMAPRMNEMVKAARARGALIIHCPSDTMDFYKDHPGRKLAQAAPKVETLIPLENWCSLKPDKEAPLPIDDSDGGCDGCPDCPSFKAWSRQHPALEIMDGDAVTDSAEAFYLMRQRGITNVIVMGVHINMCVLGRPFSIRQMVRQGQNVVLVRDLTDSMYNHRKAPFVSHFRGTELVTEHIEKFWCPSITSSDFLGGEPFRFKGDVKKEVCFIIGENEYRTWETLPEFARKELAWRGYKLSFVTASQNTDDFDFQNWEAIPRADLLVISTRRRAAPKPMMDALRAHVAAGKAIVGIRTASHGFELRGKPNPADTTWADFDTDVLGGDYQDHYGKGPGKDTILRQITETAGNPILNNVDATFRSPSHLYKSRKLLNTVTPLLRGQTEDGTSEVEPVAWINTLENRRVFYTSLGAPEDFAEPNFRRLLLNGILWALDEYIAPATPRPVDYAGAWQTLKVPGTWDDNSQGRLTKFDGFAWYRCWAKIPADWPAEAQFALEQLDDAGEVFLDGQRLGAAGKLPPNYTSGLGPEKTFAVKVTPGSSHFVAIRVFDNGGRGGFKGRAPELRANGQALRLDGEWQFRTGDNILWAATAPETATESGNQPLAGMTTRHQIGSFQLTSSRIVISDPSYEVKTIRLGGSLGCFLEPCEVGTWNVEVDEGVSPAHGWEMPRSITASVQGFLPSTMSKWTRLESSVGGDTGMVGLFDIAHFHEVEVVPKNQKWTFDEKPVDPTRLWWSYIVELRKAHGDGYRPFLIPFGYVFHWDGGMSVEFCSFEDRIVAVRLSVDGWSAEKSE